MPELRIRIAGMTLALSPADPLMHLRLNPPAERFRVEGGPADLRACVRWADLPEKPAGQLLFDSGGIWRLYSEGDRRRFEFSPPGQSERPYKTASFEPDFRSGEICLDRSFFLDRDFIEPLEYPLDELLVVQLLSRGRGAEVHACAAVDAAGQGHLFAGQSGAGKTTLARLWQQHEGHRVLSDERVILRQEQGELWIHGTPWHGEGGYAEPRRAPLRQVYFLQHGRENLRVPLSGAEAAARLFACSFPVFYDARGLEFTLTFYDEVVRRIPCHELRCVPDRRLVPFLSS